MDRIELDACALNLIAIADGIRKAAHGRTDALEMHDIARTLEASAGRLVALERKGVPQAGPSG